MAQERKARRRDATPDKRDVAVRDVRDKRSVPAKTVEGEVIESPLGAPDYSPGTTRRERARRYGTWAGGALLVLLLLSPVFSWFSYQSQNVTSTNAAVRAHLAEIGTRIDGLVKSVEVDEGDRVAAGQVLVRLEDDHLQAEVQEATAELEGLRQSLEIELLDIAHERQEAAQIQDEAEARVAAAEAQRSAARIRAEEARRVQSMQEDLFSRGGAISGEDVKNARSARRTAEAEAKEAEANHDAALSAGDKARLAGESLSIRERKISILETNVLKAEARLKRAEVELESAAIRAPEDGAVVRRDVQPGGSVEVGQPVISMWLGRDVWVEAWVDEDDLGDVHVGSEATLTFHAFPDREFPGVVERIGLVTDFELPDTDVPQPRYSRMRGAPVVGVRIGLKDPPEELLPGLSAVVAIQKPEG